MKYFVQFLLLVLLLLKLPFAVNAQNRFDKKYIVNQDTFSSGKIKSVTEKWTINYLKEPGEQDEFYRKVTVKTIEYFESGQTKSVTKKVELNGTFGKACGEPVFKQKVWYANGKLKYFEKRKCDLHHSIVKEFDEKGRLKSKTTIKKPNRTNH